MAKFSPKPYEPYEKINQTDINLKQLLNFHVSELLTCVSKRITERERGVKIHGPYQLKVHNSS